MLNVGGPEILVILLVALIVLGPTKRPRPARQIGKAMTEFRRIQNGFKAELRDVNEPFDTTTPAPGSTVHPNQPPAEPAPGTVPDLASSPVPPPSPNGAGDDGQAAD